MSIQKKYYVLFQLFNYLQCHLQNKVNLVHLRNNIVKFSVHRGLQIVLRMYHYLEIITCIKSYLLEYRQHLLRYRYLVKTVTNCPCCLESPNKKNYDFNRSDTYNFNQDFTQRIVTRPFAASHTKPYSYINSNK